MDVTKPVFVFGSNLSGRHGMGAAYYAKLQYGAIWGVGEGMQGQSYGIPTKDENLRKMSLLQIKRHVDTFLKFAKKNPAVTFNVTAIGTGLAGFKHDDIAPMFYDAPVNCKLPVAWRDYVMYIEGRKFWIS